MRKIITAYHGTTSTSLLILGKKSSSGTFGAGYYYGDLACAINYADGGLIKKALIELSNPIEYDAQYDESTDGYALHLVKKLFGSNSAHFIQMMRQTDYFYLGDEFSQAVKGLGHDGIVVKYDCGAFEIIAFDKCCIETVSIESSQMYRGLNHD